MKKIICLLPFVFCLLSGKTFSQYTNLYWNIGRHSALDFGTGIPNVILNDSCTNGLTNTSTSICNKNGGLIFYSNGLRVFNKNGHIMPSGNGFNQGTISNTYAATGSFNPQWKGAIIIPFPKDTNKFYMFYENLEWNINGAYLPEKLYYLVVDKSLNSGMGDVISKDQKVISGDTLTYGEVLAIKHGNGQDWWILCRKFTNNTFYSILVDSSGVHSPLSQQIGITYNDTLPINGVCNISEDGQKLAYLRASVFYNPPKSAQMDLFDFDRCSGNLYNYSRIYLPNTKDTIIWSSACFSPNKKFIYCTDGNNIWQLDLHSNNILNSKIVIGKDSIGYRSYFMMKVGTDNKIYISPYGSDNYISVIEKPDSLGLSCQFRENMIKVGISVVGPWADGGLPNTPNFALGKLNCPTGIEEQLINNEALTVYPNPCGDKLTVSSNQFTVNTIEVTDMLGRLVKCKWSKLNINNCQLNTENLPSGIYFLKAVDEKGKIYNSKFVKE